MKKNLLLLLLVVMSLSAHAQFEKKKAYVSASMSGLSMSYSSNEKVRLGVDLMGGYFVQDSWMLYAKFGYTHTRHTDDFATGAGFRYFFTQNGIFLGTGLQYEHVTHNVNNLQLCPEVGYVFFLNRYLTLEPSVYYNMSMNDFADGSKVGLRIGLGCYF